MFEGSDSSVVLSRLRAGGVNELMNLFEEHRESLRKLIRRRIKGKLTARFDESDIIQEAFVRAESQLEAYLKSPKLHPSIWVRVLCRQLLFEYVRTQLRECRTPLREVELLDGQPIVEVLADSTGSAGKKLVGRETLSLVTEALATLNPLEQEILDMRHAEGMRFREIAEALEMKTDTTKKRYYRALSKLRSQCPSLAEC